jgi:8-oxo-dGTP diphosphatase
VTVQIVTAAILEKDGRILIAKRKKGDHLEYRWEFPGGKLESGETPKECLRRELFEEFGIEVKVGEFVCSSRYTYRHGCIELRAFKVEYLSGRFVIHDHEEIAWALPGELGNYDFAEADIPIAKMIRISACGAL